MAFVGWTGLVDSDVIIVEASRERGGTHAPLPMRILVRRTKSLERWWIFYMNREFCRQKKGEGRQ